MGVICTTLNEDISNVHLSDESKEKNDKQYQYFNSIITHIDNVQTAYRNEFLPLLYKDDISNKISDSELKDAITSLHHDINNHDKSKFSDEEFDGYREKYYPTSYESSDPEFQENVDQRAEEAWQHHYQNNDHHPEYWVDYNSGEKKDMSLKAIIHMICDWRSFNLNDLQKTIDWYENDAVDEKNAMTDNTKELVDEIIYNILRRYNNNN